jgi:hypothetical protein
MSDPLNLIQVMLAKGRSMKFIFILFLCDFGMKAYALDEECSSKVNSISDAVHVWQCDSKSKSVGPKYLCLYEIQPSNRTAVTYLLYAKDVSSWTGTVMGDYEVNWQDSKPSHCYRGDCSPKEEFLAAFDMTSMVLKYELLAEHGDDPNIIRNETLYCKLIEPK